MKLSLKRLLSGFIDFIILSLIVVLGFPLLDALNIGHYHFYYTILVLIIYGLILETVSSQTIGKRVLNLYVVHSKTGKRKLSFWQSFIRNLFRPIDYIGGWGIIPILIFQKRLGDYISKTEVREITIDQNNKLPK